MKILVLPKDVNPYQTLLYSSMSRHGVKARYIGRLIPTHGLNIFLLPVEMTINRLLGARVVHLHWVWFFTLPGANRFRFIRLISQLWFLFCLRLCRMLGLRLVWTAHNVLPHDPVFADDIAMRRKLVANCDFIIAHSRGALRELGEIGASPRRSIIIPHGPFAPSPNITVLRQPGSDGLPCRVLFIGRVKAYKGVGDLLEAFDGIPEGEKLQLTIAGQCDDPVLLARLQEFARRDDVVMKVGKERLSDDELSSLLSAADVVVLPFKKITTSGSAILALSHGRPIIIPDVRAMSDMPSAAVIRYDGSIAGLRSAMTTVAAAVPDELGRMGEAAMAYANNLSWDKIAELTVLAMMESVSRGR